MITCKSEHLDHLDHLRNNKALFTAEVEHLDSPSEHLPSAAAPRTQSKPLCPSVSSVVKCASQWMNHREHGGSQRMCRFSFSPALAIMHRSCCRSTTGASCSLYNFLRLESCVFTEVDA